MLEELQYIDKVGRYTVRLAGEEGFKAGGSCRKKGATAEQPRCIFSSTFTD